MIPWRALYPLVVLVGLAISYWALRYRYSRSSLNGQEKATLGLAAFIGAMLGAKAPFLMTMEATDSSWLWISDGKTILGGIFGGYIAVELAKSCMRIRIRTGDNFAVPVAIAIAFGRIGCFLSGCCYGKITALPWGVHFPLAGDAEHVLRHPTQLFEAAFHLIALALLLLFEARGWFSGRRLTIYLLTYLIYRFLTEWIRPEAVTSLGLTSYQLACLVLFWLLLVVEIAKSRVTCTVEEPVVGLYDK